ncbi:Cytochrome c [Rhodobacteraceae bacterium THAF1]|uniref:sulfur oxidation c-type cytochrome SoxX n=1 Tax=Palleronia sp. THAF1 TaxID=2587842 RepID=UPI000F3B12BC|nr:sulfur oxidation c-type cytochrome SoxX [Palleronia sp. THAF1]QFU09065.1 Cytochrome c [Palleronia sp. THAF1]VDC24134.1 Cytochrome c [Rhodobacteraceae bacterium THAF1]
MKISSSLWAGAFALTAGAAFAQTAPAPTEVVYDDYGSVAESLTGQTGDAAAGAEVVSNKSMGNCIACHQVSDLADVPFQGEVGPSLDGVADRWTEADLRGIIANAKMVFPGTIMPAFYKNDGYIRPGNAYTGKPAEGTLDPLLSADQVENVVAYLMTLKEN